MSSIHYKFKATLEYKTLIFDGLHISVNDLKKEICEKENIKAESFDLLLTNAHTKRQYTTDELIPRNSSVIVQRTPRDNALKLPKVQDSTNSGIVSKATTSETGFVTHIDSEEFNKMTEEERLAHVKEVSSYKYQPANFPKRTSSILSGPPPPTYVCNRCSQPGHWYKNCPMLNTRRTTGITMDELMETTPDDPLAMLHPSGKYVVPIMHWKARQQKKVETGPVDVETRPTPAELKCPLCSQLLRDAVLATCCGDSFCAECVQQRLLDASNAMCPGANCHSAVSADKIVPNLKVRQAVEVFKNGPSASHSSAVSLPASGTTEPKDGGSPAPRKEESVPVQPVTRVRIGLSSRPQLNQPPPPTNTSADAQKDQQLLSMPVNQGAETIVPVSTTLILPQTVNHMLPTAVMDKNVPLSVPTASRSGPIISTSGRVIQVDVHQPPPGYAPIPPPGDPARVAVSESILHSSAPRESHSNVNVLRPMNTSAVLLPPGMQPPPPGLSAPTQFPAVAAPPPVKDAWDEFLERKEKDRQRAEAFRSRSRRYSRSSSYSSSSSSSESSSESRSRSRSWSRERKGRRRSSRDRRSSRRKDSRSPPRPLYTSSRYHRDRDQAPTFGLYQHPPPTPVPLVGATSMQHNRFAQLGTSFPPPSFMPMPAAPLTSFPSYTSSSTLPASYRPPRTYLDDRSSRRRSPRYSESERRKTRRRSASRERESEKKERKREDKKRSRETDEKVRTEERTHKFKQRDAIERGEKKEKNRDGNGRKRHEKENSKVEEERAVSPVVEVNSEGHPSVESNAPKSENVEEKGIRAEEEKESECIAGGVIKEEQGEQEDEEALNPVEGTEGSVSGADVENADGIDLNEDSEGRDREKEGKKKKKKKKKKHKREERLDEEKDRKKRQRHYEDDEDEEHEKHRKNKKHKRSREEKEKRREEKEKRRAERRRRRKEEDESGRQSELDPRTNSQCPSSEHHILSDGHGEGSDQNACVGGLGEVMGRSKSEREEEKGNSKNEFNGNDVQEKRERNEIFSGKIREEEKSAGAEANKEEKKQRERSRGKRKLEKKSRDEEVERKKGKEAEERHKTEKPADDRYTSRSGRPHGDRRDDKPRKEINRETEEDKGRDREKKERSEKVKPVEQKAESNSEVKRAEKRQSEVDRNDRKKARDDEDREKERTRERALREGEQKKPEGVHLGKLEAEDSKHRKANSKRWEQEEKRVTTGRDGTEMKKVDEVKSSIEKEIASGKATEEKRSVDVLKNRPSLKVEVKSGGEKKVTRETIFENSSSHFNARQKIKMIIFPESSRPASDRTKRKLPK